MSEAKAGNKDNHRDCDPQWTEARFFPLFEMKKTKYCRWLSPWGHFTDYLSYTQQELNRLAINIHTNPQMESHYKHKYLTPG